MRAHWVGQRPSHPFLVEIVGDPTVTQITATVAAGSAGGTFVGQLLSTYAPGTIGYFQDVMNSYAGTDLDQSRSFGDREVRIQTVTAVDGALVIVTVSAV